MNDLTLSLIVLGLLILVGLGLHGAWLAHKAGPRRAEPAPPSDREWREPVLDGNADGVEPSPVLLDPSADPVADTAAPHAPIDDLPPPSPKRFVLKIDALVDVIVPIALDASLTGETLLQHLPTTRRAGSKPYLIEGFNPAVGVWEQPVAGSRYSELQAGLQLANRSGALNEIEFSEFVQKIEAFAQSVGGTADFPDMLEVVARARELDHFASQHDAQVAVDLRARHTAWSVGYIQQQVSSEGLTSGLLSGRMVRPSDEEGAPPVLVLSFDSQAAMADDPNLAALRQVTLSFDVPQTEATLQPFELWKSTARALALRMEAHVMDDRGQILDDAAFDGIEQALQKLYLALEQRGLPAGSMAARRLFS